VFCVFDVSKQLEEQNKIVEQLEETNENLSRQIYQLEKQLLTRAEQQNQTSQQDHGGFVDEVRIQIKHKVIMSVFVLMPRLLNSALRNHH